MTNEATAELDLATVLSRSTEVLGAEIDGEAVMMSIEKGEYYGLDATGTAIWEFLEKPRSVGEICRVMHERYDVEPDVCRQDVTGNSDRSEELSTPRRCRREYEPRAHRTFK